MIKFLNILVYVGLFIGIITISTIGFFIKKKNNILGSIVGIWLPILILILFSTFKNVEIGVDTRNYQQFYTHEISSLSTFSQLINAKYDFLFTLLFRIFYLMRLPFRFLIFVIYLLIYIPIGYIIFKYSKSASISFAVFLGWSFFAFNLSGLRQAISISLSLLSLFMFMEKSNIKKVASIAIYMVSILFHFSSIIFLIAFFLIVFKINYKSISLLTYSLFGAVLFIAAPAIYQFIFSLSNINYYIPILKTNVGLLFFLYLTIFIFLFLLDSNNKYLYTFFSKIDALFNRKKTVEKEYVELFFDNKVCVHDKLLLVFYIGVLFYSLSAVSNSIVRFALPFLITSIVLIPNELSKIKCLKARTLTASMICFAFLALALYEHILPNDMNICPGNVYIF